jgi:glycosyltransferase involved in cell wall biosynthesis
MFVVPNVVDIHAYRGGDAEDPATILYAGDMNWYPNCDALRYFVREILPRVQKEVPGVRLVAAGRNPSVAFRAEFADVGALSFTGTLPDLRPALRQSTVAVVPLRIGSGTRLKILEFGALGKAIVSSTLGVEGLDFVPENEILLADTPSEFAHQVIRLLRSPELRQMLGWAARRRVQQDYCFEILDRSLANALRALSGHR